MQRLDSDLNLVVVVVIQWPVWRWHIDIGTINDATEIYDKEINKRKNRKKQRTHTLTLSMIM